MTRRAELPKADAFFSKDTLSVPTVTTPVGDTTVAPSPIARDMSPDKLLNSLEETNRSGQVVTSIEKVTLYLPSDVVRSLEVARVEMLLQRGTKVNRSEIATMALRDVLDEIIQGTEAGQHMIDKLVVSQ